MTWILFYFEGFCMGIYYIGEDFQNWKFDQGRLRGPKNSFSYFCSKNTCDKAFKLKFHWSMLYIKYNIGKIWGLKILNSGGHQRPIKSTKSTPCWTSKGVTWSNLSIYRSGVNSGWEFKFVEIKIISLLPGPVLNFKG